MALGSAIQPLIVKLGGDGSLLRKTYDKAITGAKKFQQKTNTALASVATKIKSVERSVASGGILKKPYDQSIVAVNKFSQKTKIALASVGAKIQSVSTKMKTMGKSATALGRSISLRLTAPLVLMGAASIKAFASFDQAMTESTSIMKVTVAQTEEMREAALSLSKESAQGPAELARSFFFLASAGFDAERSIAALPLVTKFATAGAFDMAQATDLLTDAQSALGLASKDAQVSLTNMTRVADVLVKANTLANASVEQFSIALTSKAGAALKSFNKDIEEGVAVLAALADQGIKAQLAGNALDRMIRLLSKASQDNQEAFEEFGFTVFDSTGKMRNMADIIGNLEEALTGMSDQQKAATLTALGFEARVQGVILPLLGTSKAIRQYEKDLRDAGGTTETVADKQMKSFANQMKKVKNQIVVAAISIGQTLVPAFKEFAKFVADTATKWTELNATTKKWILIAAGIAAAIGPLLILFGTLAQSVVAITGAVKLMSTAFVFAKTSVVGFGLALKGLLVIGAVAIIFAIADAIGIFGKAVRDSAPQVELLNKLMENLLESTKSQIDSTKSLSDLEKTRTSINRNLDNSISIRFKSEREVLKIEKKVGFGGEFLTLSADDRASLKNARATVKEQKTIQKDLFGQVKAIDAAIKKKKQQRTIEAKPARVLPPKERVLTDFERNLKRTNPREFTARQQPGGATAGAIVGRRRQEERGQQRRQTLGAVGREERRLGIGRENFVGPQEAFTGPKSERQEQTELLRRLVELEEAKGTDLLLPLNLGD